jgi:hypothetical protein
MTICLSSDPEPPMLPRVPATDNGGGLPHDAESSCQVGQLCPKGQGELEGTISVSS